MLDIGISDCDIKKESLLEFEKKFDDDAQFSPFLPINTNQNNFDLKDELISDSNISMDEFNKSISREYNLELDTQEIEVDKEINNAYYYESPINYNNSFSYESNDGMPTNMYPYSSDFGNQQVLVPPMFPNFHQTPYHKPPYHSYNHSNHFNLSLIPEDTIVYVPTPISALNSNYVNNPFNLDYSFSYSNISRSDSGISSNSSQNPATQSKYNPRKSKVKTSNLSIDKQFHCPTCMVKFSRRDELRRHEKIHSGERPLSCPYCDKCFIRSDHRKTHIRTHTGEKPYTCDICQKKFARSDEKLRHRKIHFKSHSRRGRKRLVPPAKSIEADTTTKLEDTFLSEPYTETSDDLLEENDPLNNNEDSLMDNDLNTNDLSFTDLLDSLLNN